MSLYTIKALDDRAGFTGEHRTSQFTRRGDGWSRESVPFSATRTLLARELDMIDATNVVLEVDVLPGQIRLDGELYATAKVRSPAVRLHFDSPHGHLTYATDTFTTWQDNVRAIALALESLRKIERYGVGRGDEQYQGWLAIESGTGATPLGGMTRDQAASVLSRWSGIPIDADESEQSKRARWKESRRATHPDRNGGVHDHWDSVETAARVLGLSS